MEDFKEESAQRWESIGNRWLGLCWANILLLVGLSLYWIRTESTHGFWACVASVAFWFVCAYFCRLYYGRANELRSNHGKPPLP